MALSRLEKQMARLLVELPETDPALQRLLVLTDLGDIDVGLTLTVSVGGQIIRGNLMGAKRYAEQLDERLEAGLTKYVAEFEEGEPQRVGAEAWRKAMTKNSFTKVYEAQIEAEEEHEQAMARVAAEKGKDTDDLKLDDLPDDLALDEVATHPYPPRATLTLENAVRIGLPFGHEDALGTVRVQVSQIGAWWTDIGTAPEPSDPEG